MSVYKKLNDARREFHKTALKKTGRNEFSKYDYFTLGDIVQPALAAFQNAGLCAVVTFDKDIATMTTPEGVVTADCQFCGKHYEFDPKSLGFEAAKAADAG